MQKVVHGDHVPAIQNPNIQPGVFLAKMKGQQLMSFFVYCHLMNF